MKDLRTLLIFTLFLLFLAGCGPARVYIQGRVPAAIDTGGIKHIAVLDFAGAQNRPLSGKKAPNLLIAKLIEQQYYQVIERSQMDKILSEHALSMSGIIDERTAKQIGKILGVETVITGEVSTYEVETQKGIEQVERQEGTGRYKKVTRKNIFTGKEYEAEEEIMRTVLAPEDYVVKRGSVSLNFRMINIETGVIIGATTEEESYKQKASGSYQIGKLLADEEILDALMNKVTDKFVRKISPHFVNRERYLESGKDDLTAQGVKLAKNSLWDEAIEVWKQAVQINDNNAFAHNNLGIAYEKANRLDEALAEYKKALLLNPSNQNYMRNLKEIKEAYREN